MGKVQPVTQAEALAVILDYAEDVGEAPPELHQRLLAAVSKFKVAGPWYNPDSSTWVRYVVAWGSQTPNRTGYAAFLVDDGEDICAEAVPSEPSCGRYRALIHWLDLNYQNPVPGTTRDPYQRLTRRDGCVKEAQAWADAKLAEAGWLVMPPIDLKGEGS